MSCNDGGAVAAPEIKTGAGMPHSAHKAVHWEFTGGCEARGSVNFS